MYLVLLFGLVVSVSAKFCPEVSPVNNFNFAAYGQGTWYEVARYPHPAEIGDECGSAEYKLEGDVIKVKNYGVIKNKRRLIEGSARLAPDAGNTGKVIHTLPYGAGGAMVDSLLNIVAIDYDKFLIGYYCKYNKATQNYHDFAWILSRSKIVLPETKAIIDKHVKDSDFLDNDKLIWPDFSDVVCNADN